MTACLPGSACLSVFRASIRVRLTILSGSCTALSPILFSVTSVRPVLIGLNLCALRKGQGSGSAPPQAVFRSPNPLTGPITTLLRAPLRDCQGQVTRWLLIQAHGRPMASTKTGFLRFIRCLAMAGSIFLPALAPRALRSCGKPLTSWGSRRQAGFCPKA